MCYFCTQICRCEVSKITQNVHTGLFLFFCQKRFAIKAIQKCDFKTRKIFKKETTDFLAPFSLLTFDDSSFELEISFQYHAAATATAAAAWFAKQTESDRGIQIKIFHMSDARLFFYLKFLWKPLNGFIFIKGNCWYKQLLAPCSGLCSYAIQLVHILTKLS